MATQVIESEIPRWSALDGTSPTVRDRLSYAHPSLERIPALDAMRGLAILIVTVYRFFPPYDDPSFAGRALSRVCEYGPRGVDLFFVLSGFLITGILYDSKCQSHYFRNFYMRRVLRIFPLYYGALLLTLLILPAIGLTISSAFAEGREYSPWLWLYGTNLLIAWKGDWCLGAYNHFWSLAVEEHFYLVWPLVIFFCSRPAAIRACVGAIALSIAARAACLWWGGNEVAVEVFTLFRIDALAMGGLLALIARGPNDLQKVRPWAFYCGLVVVVAMLPPVFLGRRVPIVRDTMYAILFSSVLVLAVTAPPARLWSRFWNAPALRFLGKYSYGMYIVQNFLKAAFPAQLFIVDAAAVVGSVFWSRCSYLVVMSLATLLAALASWHLLEKHFLQIKSRFEYSNTKHRSIPDQSPVETLTPAVFHLS